MERKLWSVLHQHLNVLNGCGISFQLNSLARINHVGPLNHKGAKEYVSILSWKPKIFGEQCWCLRTIYVSHLHSCYYKILHAHGKYSFAQYTVYFSFFFLRLFLLLDLGSLLLSHSAVYTHLEMPGLWDSPWSMGIGNQWVHIPLFLPQAGESQRVLHGMEVGCPWWSALLNFLDLTFCSCSTFPATPLLSPGITSQNKLPPHVLLGLNALCFGKTWAREASMPLQLELYPSSIPGPRVRWIFFLYHAISC